MYLILSILFAVIRPQDILGSLAAEIADIKIGGGGVPGGKEAPQDPSGLASERVITKRVEEVSAMVSSLVKELKTLSGRVSEADGGLFFPHTRMVMFLIFSLLKSSQHDPPF